MVDQRRRRLVTVLPGGRPTPAPPGAPEERPGAARLIRPVTGRGDVVFRWLVLVMAVALLALTAVIFWELFSNARPLLARDGLSFIWREVWDVPRDQFGARAMLLGTLISSCIAVMLAEPMELGIVL